MTAKVLLLAALVATALATPQYDCNAKYAAVKDARDQIFNLVNPLIHVRDHINGCSAKDAFNLAANLYYRAIVQASGLAGQPIPKLEKPIIIPVTCETLKQIQSQFNSLLLKHFQAVKDAQNCGCQANELEEYVNTLVHYYNIASDYVGSQTMLAECNCGDKYQAIGEVQGEIYHLLNPMVVGNHRMFKNCSAKDGFIVASQLYYKAIVQVSQMAQKSYDDLPKPSDAVITCGDLQPYPADLRNLLTKYVKIVKRAHRCYCRGIDFDGFLKNLKHYYELALERSQFFGFVKYLN
ncbi:hypothetical protein L596_008899 [Steinernema carpocapsae]|uniref:Uncharacterized protein n=1 Tax=Steinernema carpocapsae TaxID=34508 RepID=A0A4U5PDT8_STECR|nr:hypothetical protein L596_008899 [Steinernema carpocapsae]